MKKIFSKGSNSIPPRNSQPRQVTPTPQQLHNGGGVDSTDDSSDSSSDIFSPYQPFRPSLIPKSPGNEILPPNHDSSWIGARMSPIQSYDEDNPHHINVHDDNDMDDDDDDDDDDRLFTEPYRKALHDSTEAASASSLVSNPNYSNVASERTSLLGRGGKNKNKKTYTNSGDEENVVFVRSNSPLVWDEGKDFLFNSYANQYPRRMCSMKHWGNIVCLNSGIYLGCIGIHDLYVWYVSYRLGIIANNSNYNSRNYNSMAWKLPWLCPSETTLIRFGAFVSNKVLYEEENSYWRILSSMFLCTSIVEWIFLIWSWTALQAQQPPNTGGVMSPRPISSNKPVWIIVVYVLSIITGQLWMVAFDHRNVSGCALWGTCGVLCASGIAKPHRRFAFFMTAILLILLSLAQEPCSSVLGSIASSFFGWSFYDVVHFNNRRVLSNQREKPSSPVGIMRFISGVSVLVLWILPLLRISMLREEYYATYEQ